MGVVEAGLARTRLMGAECDTANADQPLAPHASHLFRRMALLAKRPQAERIVAFCESDAVGISHERAVKKWRLFVTKRAVEEELAASAREEVGSANDFGDAQIVVIDRAGELVTRLIVFSPNKEVAEILASNFGVQAKRAVGEGNLFPIRYAKAPVHTLA